jgi:uncharacterized phage protein (TIGR01671 family)
MNREIKFQVLEKNKIIGIERLNGTQWEWQYFLLNPDKGERWCAGVFGNAPDLIRRQFTGLKDKKGNEIYEGDVCICPRNGQKRDTPLEVKYGGQCQFYLHESGTEKIFNMPLFSDNIEVVGNIHEHPELLK